MRDPIPFSGSPLDRAEAQRRDPVWIRDRLASETTKVLPVWKLSVLVRSSEPLRLAWATPSLLEDREGDAVLLGLVGDTAHFAMDVSASAEPLAEFGWQDVAEFPDLRAVAGQLPAGEAAIAAQARHVVDWHARHVFCPGCGQKTRAKDAGWSRLCVDCSTEHFPRTDPVVIMIVSHGDRCLLGRQHNWPKPFFSALAGFVEPGESLEEAVRRATDLQVDHRELEEARWFTLDQVRAALAGGTPELGLPPPLAIAHHLIRSWADPPG
jgi:NAD+ diphosphatase